MLRLVYFYFVRNLLLPVVAVYNMFCTIIGKEH